MVSSSLALANVTSYEAPDGVITYSTNQYSGDWIGIAGGGIKFNKVVRQDKDYYFLQVWRYNAFKSKKPFLSIGTIIADGTKRTAIQRIELPNEVDGYFLIPEQSIEEIKLANTVRIVIPQAEGKVAQIDIKPATLSEIKRIIGLTKQDFIRNGSIIDRDLTSDDLPEVIWPSIYIPNVRPEQLVDPLIYFTNNQKDLSPFLGGYSYIERGPTEDRIQFTERRAYKEEYLTFTTILKPFGTGTFISAKVGGRMWDSSSRRYELYGANNNSFNRITAKLFQHSLNHMMEQTYGTYYYGFSVTAKEKGSTDFLVLGTDINSYPELNGILKGARLVAVDGISAAKLCSLDIDRMTTYGDGKQRSFTFKTITGEEKTVTVVPKLDTKNKKEIGTLKADTPKWVSKRGFGYDADGEDDFIYDPLTLALRL